MSIADDKLTKQDEKIEQLNEKSVQQKFDIDKLMSTGMVHSNQIKEMQGQVSKLFQEVHRLTENKANLKEYNTDIR